jgi:hypothetical protein
MHLQYHIKILIQRTQSRQLMLTMRSFDRPAGQLKPQPSDVRGSHGVSQFIRRDCAVPFVKVAVSCAAHANDAPVPVVSRLARQDEVQLNYRQRQ